MAIGLRIKHKSHYTMDGVCTIRVFNIFQSPDPIHEYCG